MRGTSEVSRLPLQGVGSLTTSPFNMHCVASFLSRDKSLLVEGESVVRLRNVGGQRDANTLPIAAHRCPKLWPNGPRLVSPGSTNASPTSVRATLGTDCRNGSIGRAGRPEGKRRIAEAEARPRIDSASAMRRLVANLCLGRSRPAEGPRAASTFAALTWTCPGLTGLTPSA